MPKTMNAYSTWLSLARHLSRLGNGEKDLFCKAEQRLRSNRVSGRERANPRLFQEKKIVYFYEPNPNQPIA
jgi:hypothetical protein